LWATHVKSALCKYSSGDTKLAGSATGTHRRKCEAHKMNTIDYVYRFDPRNPSTKPPPPDAEAARKTLEDGNRMFARWMESCRSGTYTTGEQPRHVVQCNGLEVGMVRKEGGMPKHAPFAVVIGCSDARVPTEMLFGQGFNDLFVIRVAGNVLGDVCIGSVNFAVEELSESVKVLVVLGHSGCGAVTGAVEAYLHPLEFWSDTISPALRSILQRIFVSVREAANALKTVWGSTAREMPGFRDALIETTVCLNAAQAAFALRQEIESAGSREIEVLYGVYNLFNHQVSMPNDPFAPPSDMNVRLASAPTDPREFTSLAIQMAEILKRHQTGSKPPDSAEKETLV
jgi:carbonic anhydrase